MPAKSIIEDLMFCIKKKKEKAGVRGGKVCGEIWTKQITVQFLLCTTQTHPLRIANISSC